MGDLLRHRRRILRNAWNDLRYRHAGTGAGFFWNVASPLLQLLVYAALLRLLLPQRAGSHALLVCAGLLPWLSFSESLLRGSQCLLRHAAILRSFPLPGEVFVAQSAVTGLFALLISLALLVPATLLSGEPLAGALLELPLVAALLHGLAFGLSLALASLRVLFRDVGEMLRSLMHLWMWTLPVVYPEWLLPGGAAPAWMRWNPPYVFLKSFRGILLEQHSVPASDWAVMACWAAAAAALGGLAAARLRDEVRDAL